MKKVLNISLANRTFTLEEDAYARLSEYLDTEACMASLRIARIATGKKRVIKIGGAYHGWSDQLVYGLKIPGSRGLLESHGIPSAAYRQTDECRPNDLNMLESLLKINRLKGGTAAVLIEPVGPESGTRPVAQDYNKHVRELCDKYGALMVFDEVVTGFRVGIGGAQGYFDVKPDLTIFGKIVAGGSAITLTGISTVTSLWKWTRATYSPTFLMSRMVIILRSMS